MQLIDIFLKELLSKLISIIRESNLKIETFDCPNILNDSIDTSLLGKNSEPNQFESQLLEAISKMPIIKQYQNSSYSFEYYLKMNVFGREGNSLRVLSDESPVLTDLATIDNKEFLLTPNVSIKAPRRFFRIGITEVCIKVVFDKKISSKYFCFCYCNEH